MWNGQIIMKKSAVFIVVFGIVGLLVGAFVFRDICIYIDGGRPWSSTVDGVCDIFFHPKRNNIVAKVPLSGDSLHLVVSHRWRGKYQFRLWIPDEIPDNVAVTEQIGLDSTFFDRDGNKVYVNHTPPTPHAWWLKVNRNLPLGSEMDFRMYLAPDDVPLDDELSVNVKFYGQFNKFYAAHTNACLVLVKERDK